MERMIAMYCTIQELPIILNAVQVAAVLGISKSRAYQLFLQKDFPTVQIGRRKLVSRDAFWTWFQAQERKGGDLNRTDETA